jgi:predicted nucleic acid-binding protein
MNYLDSSAIIKRFTAEKGSERVQSIIEQEGPVATAKITYAEIHSGLARKKREGFLSSGQYALICRRVEVDWSAYVRMELTDEVLSLARALIQRHPLRGFDAIHLASALILKASLGEQVTFAGADERQLQAAAKEQLIALNVETA